MKKVIVLFGAVFAAIAASACCILPVLLGIASAGSLGLGAMLAPYRPYLMGTTFLLLAIAFYLSYRPAKSCCSDESACTSTTDGARRTGRIMLWIVTFVALAAMVYPEIAAYRARAAASRPPSPAPAQVASRQVQTATGRTVTFHIDKMTCADCALSIVTALKSVPGVHDARVDFDARQATVRYDAERVGIPKLQKTIDRTGFTATMDHGGAR